MSLKLVPFNPAWISHDKLDLKAMYRRPRFVADEFGEFSREYDPNGLPTWDIVGPLPVKQHTRWQTKGFEYITLADRASLVEAWRKGTLPPGEHARDYDQHQTGGPWNYRKFIDGANAQAAQDAEHLKSLVERLGSEAVEAVKRSTEPGFVLPEALRGIKPKGKVPA